jgi:hypothetical protein
MPYSKLLKFPYGSYLMVRLDYIVICGDELEAKIMRIIEQYMDDERRRMYQDLLNDPKSDTKAEDTVEITKDVWASISHRLFMNDLYHQVKSENTLKRALKSLKDKGFIHIRDKNLKQYEAPKYQIDTDVTQGEFDKLARVGKAGYQKLIPSKSDTIKNSYHQDLTPSGYQELTPSSGSRVSKIDTNSRRVYEVEDTVEESTYTAPESQSDDSDSTIVSPHTHSLSQFDTEALGRRIYEASQQDPATLPPIMYPLSQPQPQGEPDVPTHPSNSRRPGAANPNRGCPQTEPDEPAHGTQPSQSSQVVSPDEDRTAAQLSTSQQSYPQARAKVEKPARSQSRAPIPVFSNAPLFAAPPKVSNRAQLTEVGKQVLEWYDTIRTMKARRTNANIDACNGLAEEDGISFVSLKEAIEHWEADGFVKKNQIPIDLQQLENPKGKFTYAKAMLAMQCNGKPKKAPKDDLYSPARIAAEQNAAWEKAHPGWETATWTD